jgi:hypothetical protein
MGETAGAHDRLLATRHLRRRLHVEKAFRGHPLDEIIEELGELGLSGVVSIAAQSLEHLGGELAALDERLEDRFAECIE